MFYAASEGIEEILVTLLERGAALDMQDQHGRTALMMAIKEGHPTCAKRLISLGADVNTTDQRGNGPIHFASVSNCIPIINDLLEKEHLKVDKNNNGFYPHHMATDDAVRKVLQEKADQALQTEQINSILRSNLNQLQQWTLKKLGKGE